MPDAFVTIASTAVPPPPPGSPDSTAYWHRRAVWAENSLVVIERELLEVERARVGRRRGLDVLWRLKARYPRTWERLTAHRDRDDERRLASRRYRQRDRRARR